MPIELRRWKRMWFLLSLDRVGLFWLPLWLPARNPGGIRKMLQDTLAPYLTGERFYHEAYSMTMQVMDRLVALEGPAALARLRDWCVHVLVDAGPDRAQESYWSSISASVGKGAGTVPEWVRERFRAVNENKRRRKEVLEAQRRTQAGNSPSKWDESILPFTHSTADDVDTTIRLIISLNSFSEAWRDECGDLSTEELVTLGEVVQPLKGELSMMEVSIEPPGLWLHEVGDFMKTSASA